MMTVNKTNTRISVTISKENYIKLQELASKEQRSVSNMAAKIITEKLNKK